MEAGQRFDVSAGPPLRPGGGPGHRVPRRCRGAHAPVLVRRHCPPIAGRQGRPCGRPRQQHPGAHQAPRPDERRGYRQARDPDRCADRLRAGQGPQAPSNPAAAGSATPKPSPLRPRLSAGKASEPDYEPGRIGASAVGRRVGRQACPYAAWPQAAGPATNFGGNEMAAWRTPGGCCFRCLGRPGCLGQRLRPLQACRRPPAEHGAQHHHELHDHYHAAP